MNIPLIKPYITQEIKDKVIEVLESGYLTEGPVTREFENKLKEFLGVKHCLAVTSATTGLEVALRALNIGAGDEIIAPDYTYPATAAVGPIVGAKAVIVDVEKDTMNIDYDAIEAAITPRTKAIIPVSLFGSPLDYDRLNAIKEKYGVYIVEDAACSIGAEFKGVKVGSQADITIFSLHPRKFITTGEGGIITTQNDEWANWMNSYKHFGMNMNNTAREGVQFEIIGTNYKLSNIQAAVGLGQLHHINKLLSRRIELANNYIKLFKNVEGVEIPRTLTNGQHSYQTFCVFVEDRDRIMVEMRAKGIEVQIGTYSLHQHNAFKNGPLIEVKGAMGNSSWCYKHALALPLYNDLTEELQEKVVLELKTCL
ncbi:DegT/DnrJ/EryC1/StrS family aminotransferase [Corallibacter sp.]|uniref:DegT/DnrJ/EryC1/StrS family aminotransferase n=1 Tax=Corallibacter sp. TaxID=2038084 RepID=UPI003A904CE5